MMYFYCYDIYVLKTSIIIHKSQIKHFYCVINDYERVTFILHIQCLFDLVNKNILYGDFGVFFNLKKNWHSTFWRYILICIALCSVLDFKCSFFKLIIRAGFL